MRYLILLLALACSGNKNTVDEPSSKASLLDGAETAEKSGTNPKLDAACDKSMRKLSECFVADSRKHLGKDEYQGFNLKDVGQAHFRQFKDKCVATMMNKRQVEIYLACSPTLSCPEYTACLQRAEKGRTDTAKDVKRDQEGL